MRRRIETCALCILFGFLSGCEDPKEVVFDAAAPQPLARMEGAVTAVAEKLYVFGGHAQPDLRATFEVFSYDPDADSWLRHTDMPAATSHIIAAVQEDRYVWIAGGFVGDQPGSATSDVWRFDTVENSWSAGPSLPQKRASGCLATIGHTLHFFGGIGADRSTNYGDHWTLNLANMESADGAPWQLASPMPDARGHFGCVVHDGKIYAIAGQYHHDRGPDIGADDVDMVHRYDPATDSWTELASLPSNRSHIEVSTFVYRDQIWTVGGRNSDPGLFRKIWNKLFVGDKAAGIQNFSRYDIATDQWQEVGEIHAPLYAPGSSVVGDTMILTGGGTDGWRVQTDETWTLNLRDYALGLGPVNGAP